MSTIKRALQRVASVAPESRRFIIPLLRRHAACACGDEMLAEELDEMCGEAGDFGDLRALRLAELRESRTAKAGDQAEQDKMWAKGYRYMIQWAPNSNPKNRDPLYVKSPSQAAKLVREDFPDEKNWKPILLIDPKGKKAAQRKKRADTQRLAKVTIKRALQRIAAEVPETRPVIVALLRRHATCDCGDERLAGEMDEMFGARQFSPLDGGKNKDYGPPYTNTYNWDPENKGPGKCFYETGNEADRCYTTTNGGPGGKKPSTGPAGKDKSPQRNEYNKKYRQQRLKKKGSAERLAELRALRTAGGPKLDKDQLAEAKSEMVKDGVPVRFMSGGASLDIVTGEVVKKGANVMHQIVYWNFTKATANKIAKWLGVRAAFSG